MSCGKTCEFKRNRKNKLITFLVATCWKNVCKPAANKGIGNFFGSQRFEVNGKDNL